MLNKDARERCEHQMEPTLIRHNADIILTIRGFKLITDRISRSFSPLLV